MPFRRAQVGVCPLHEDVRLRRGLLRERRRRDGLRRTVRQQPGHLQGRAGRNGQLVEVVCRVRLRDQAEKHRLVRHARRPVGLRRIAPECVVRALERLDARVVRLPQRPRPLGLEAVRLDLLPPRLRLLRAARRRLGTDLLLGALPFGAGIRARVLPLRSPGRSLRRYCPPRLARHLTGARRGPRACQQHADTISLEVPHRTARGQRQHHPENPEQALLQPFTPGCTTLPFIFRRDSFSRRQVGNIVREVGDVVHRRRPPLLHPPEPLEGLQLPRGDKGLRRCGGRLRGQAFAQGLQVEPGRRIRLALKEVVQIVQGEVGLDFKPARPVLRLVQAAREHAGVELERDVHPRARRGLLIVPLEARQPAARLDGRAEVLGGNHVRPGVVLVVTHFHPSSVQVRAPARCSRIDCVRRAVTARAPRAAARRFHSRKHGA